MSETKKIHYYGIDLLRAFCCIAIIIMHIRANSAYNLSGYVYDTIIASWTQFVYLFIMISGFGMCVGYYSKVKDGKLDVNSFYGKRYAKIIPFFGFLLLISLVMERNGSTAVESFMEITLAFGLLPNNHLETIGVSWTLGVIFLFYFLFPFIVFLTYDRRRAVMSFLISIAVNYACVYYFFTDKFVVDGFAFRHCFIYCLPFFLGGVLIYLFREPILAFVTKYKIVMFLIMAAMVAAYYALPDEIGDVSIFTVKNLLISMTILSFAIGCNGKICNNKVVSYLSSISMEMYLCQMVLFRVAEKAHLLYRFGKGWLSFCVCCVIVIALIIVFVECFRFGCKLLSALKKKYLSGVKE
ncbi:MAG: acyltransferase [Ruminococcus sp.]|nr:acyltransferase [Ruminococcus sp.]